MRSARGTSQAASHTIMRQRHRAARNRSGNHITPLLTQRYTDSAWRHFNPGGYLFRRWRTKTSSYENCLLGDGTNGIPSGFRLLSASSKRVVIPLLTSVGRKPKAHDLRGKSPVGSIVDRHKRGSNSGSRDVKSGSDGNLYNRSYPRHRF